MGKTILGRVLKDTNDVSSDSRTFSPLNFTWSSRLFVAISNVETHILYECVTSVFEHQCTCHILCFISIFHSIFSAFPTDTRENYYYYFFYHKIERFYVTRAPLWGGGCTNNGLVSPRRIEPYLRTNKGGHIVRRDRSMERPKVQKRSIFKSRVPPFFKCKIFRRSNETCDGRLRKRMLCAIRNRISIDRKTIGLSTERLTREGSSLDIKRLGGFGCVRTAFEPVWKLA